MSAVLTVDRLVGEYRAQSDSRWLALAFLASCCTAEDVAAAAARALSEGGLSEAHTLAARELTDLLALGLTRD